MYWLLKGFEFNWTWFQFKYCVIKQDKRTKGKIEKNRQTNRETDRHTDWWKDRHKDRQIEKRKESLDPKVKADGKMDN